MKSRPARNENRVGLDLQKAVAVVLGHFRQLGLQAQNPVQRQTDRATPFADSRLVKMIADFLAHQLRGIGQGTAPARRPGSGADATRRWRAAGDRRGNW